MFRGMVKFRARIVHADKGITFPVVEFSPNEPGVSKVEIEGPNGNEILTAVHLTGVHDRTEGIAVATKVHLAAMDRISFRYDIALESVGTIESEFSPLEPPPSGEHRLTPATCYFSFQGHDVKFKRGLSGERLKKELEEPTLPGERYFGLFRAARQSTSPVEEFMHLYNILLMLFGDNQTDVDKFILQQNPNVRMTPHPDQQRFKNRVETVHTRLRNEFGHPRQGVNLEDTKAEIKRQLGEMIALTKRAIESHS
jgi:hypothetical protein